MPSGNSNIKFEYPKYSIISGKRIISIWLNCNEIGLAPRCRGIA